MWPDLGGSAGWLLLTLQGSGGYESSLGVEPGSCRSPSGACKRNLCPGRE